MSKIAELIKSHYAGLPVGVVHVPEWDVTIHVRPATIMQTSAIMEEKDSFFRACKLIQVRGKKEDGSPLFDDEDFRAMCSHGDADIISRVANEIALIGDVEEVDAKKP